MITKPTRFRGVRYRAVVTGSDADGWDVKVEVERGSGWETVVVGMFDAGGLSLSECSPDGERVALPDDLFEKLHDDIEEAIAEARLAADYT
jgi:hypothetical protein